MSFGLIRLHGAEHHAPFVDFDPFDGHFPLDFAVLVDFEQLSGSDVPGDGTVNDDVFALHSVRNNGAIFSDVDLLIGLDKSLDVAVYSEVYGVDVVGDGAARGHFHRLTEDVPGQVSADRDRFGGDVAMNPTRGTEDDSLFDFDIPFDCPVDVDGTAPFDVPGDRQALGNHGCTDDPGFPGRGLLYCITAAKKSHGILLVILGDINS